jgi:putative ABC transport system substrate-binding protein
MIGRRPLLAGLVSLVAAPVLVRAQAPRLRRIGFLSSATKTGAVAYPTFVRFLAALGWREGDTIQIDDRHAGGDTNLTSRLAAEIVAGQPELIVVTGVTEARAAAAATSDIPIVFMQVPDPVGLGIVSSLARPGGNITGVASVGQFLGGKRIEILVELLGQRLRRLGFLANPANPVATSRGFEDIKNSAGRHGLEASLIEVSRVEDLEPAFEKAARQDAILVQHDFVLFPLRPRVVELAAAARVPAVYENRFSPVIGGLASYGVDLRENFRQGAIYADQVLRGARPTDLPVLQSSRVELVVNIAAAVGLGLAIPSSLLARADEIVE